MNAHIGLGRRGLLNPAPGRFKRKNTQQFSEYENRFSLADISH
jgi:hypothetical protein